MHAKREPPVVAPKLAQDRDGGSNCFRQKYTI